MAKNQVAPFFPGHGVNVGTTDCAAGNHINSAVGSRFFIGSHAFMPDPPQPLQI